MALCPECHSQKPFFAPRCATCNQDISFMYQLLGMIAWLLPQVIFLLFLVWLIWG